MAITENDWGTTDNDWDNFSYIDNEIKAEVLFLYLCERHSMKEVARIMGLDDPRQVSCITRCYGLKGNNIGKLQRLELTEMDMYQFVNDCYPDESWYPNGLGVMMEYFSPSDSYEEEEYEYEEPVYERPRMSSTNRKRAFRSKNDDYNSPDFSESDNRMMDKIMTVAGILDAIAFIVMKFVWGWGWIISVILAIVLFSFIAMGLMYLFSKK